LDLLPAQLREFPDDATLEFGVEGHLSIAPIGDAGRIDTKLLADWAATRGTGHAHPLTKDLLNAVEPQDVRRPR
jgi:hypothetical protein